MDPLAFKLSLRAKRGNLVAERNVVPSTELARRFAPRNDKAFSVDPVSRQAGLLADVGPLAFKLSLRAKRGNLVAERNVVPSTELARRFAPRNDKAFSVDPVSRQAGLLADVDPLAFKLSLRAKRGNLVGERNVVLSTELARRFAPRNDKAFSDASRLVPDDGSGHIT